MQKSALIIVLVGAVGLSAAYYFPDGPPHRPARQAAPPPDSNTVHPEPKIDVDGPPKPIPAEYPGAQIITVKDVLSIPQSEQDDDEESSEKPEEKQGCFRCGKMTEGQLISIPANRSPAPKQGDEHKPEPRSEEPLTIVPLRRQGCFRCGRSTKQANTCQMNYAFSEAGQSVVMQSPNYPNDYPNNVQSSVCFSSPEGTTMTVTCDEFNVENQRTCSYDSLGLGLSGNPNNVQKYCGSGTVKSPATSGNSLAVVFTSDSSNPGASTRSPYRFKCTIATSGSGSTPTTTAAPPSGGVNGTANCSCGKRNDGTRIVGGTPATVNEFPWRCYLKTNKYSFFCGCSIISNKWIMTAAHCTAAVMPLSSGDVLYAVVGDHDRSTSTDASSQQIAVAADGVYDNPNYNSDTMDYDMSLLRLTRNITFSSTISPICLPWNEVSNEFSGQNVTASGWGTTTQGGSVSNTLLEVDLPVLTTQQCSRYYPGQITDRMICTYKPGKDTCQGDSGGSIDWLKNSRYYAIGVVSWGIGCAKENNPGVYAKTTKFLTWIQSTTNENFCKA